MATTAKATGYLELNISGFDQSLKTAKNLMATFAAGFAGYKIVDFFKDGVKNAIDFGKEMNSASRAMGGFDPGNLLLVQKAMEKAGLGAEEARGRIGDAIQAGLPLKELFLGSENFAGALKSASADYGQQAAVLTRSAAALQTVWNTMESVGAKVKTYFLAMTEQFVKPLQIALDYLNTIDLSGIGKKMGESLANAANIIIGLLANGDVWKVMGISVKWAFWGGIDILQRGFEKAVAFFSGAMKAITESFNKSWFTHNFVSMLTMVFRGLGKILSSAMMKSGAEIFRMIGITKKARNLGMLAEGESKNAVIYFKGATNMAGNIDFAQAFVDSAKAIKAGANAAKEAETGPTASGDKANAAWDAMSESIAKAQATAAKMAETAGANEKPTTVATDFQGKAGVIADNLAKVGGGGGYLITGMSIEAQTKAAVEKSAKANVEMAETTKKIEKNTGEKGKEAVLGR